jgi:hypothetical protein
MIISSDKFLLQLKPQARSYRVRDDQYPGLFLEVLPSGSMKWRYQYRQLGRRHQVTLGGFPQIGHQRARQMSESHLASLARLNDCSDSSMLTFDRLAAAWLQSRVGRRRDTEFKLSVKHLDLDIRPVLADVELSKLSATDILLKVIRPLTDRGDLEGAQRVKRLLGRLFRFGVKDGLVSCDPTRNLPEISHQFIPGRATLNIDPMLPSPMNVTSGHDLEAKPTRFSVKRNPHLNGLMFDPSHPIAD